jgi:hypothetical protein
MTVGLDTSLLATLAWKISIHVAVAAGAVVILVLVFCPGWLLLAPLVAVVGWARVVLDDHSPASRSPGRCWVPPLPSASSRLCGSRVEMEQWSGGVVAR